MKTMISLMVASSVVWGLFLVVSGCGSTEQEDGALDEELLEEPGLEASEPELCLAHMDCYDPEDDSADLNIDDLGLVSGVPALGSECPVPEPYGFEKGDRLENVQLIDSNGDPFYLHDRICGSTVGWVYFYRGPS